MDTHALWFRLPARHAVLVTLAALAAAGGGAQAQTTSATGYGHGSIFRLYPVSDVPLLDSFYFRFVQSDHHIQAIGVEPASPLPPPSPQISAVPPGQINLSYMDKSRDDEYFFTVSHAVVNGSGIVRHNIMDFCRGKICKARLQRPSPQYVFVIIGFEFFYPTTDNHMGRIAIWEENGELNVHFEDTEPDDVFRYTLEYVYLPPAAVARVGKLQGHETRVATRAAIDTDARVAGPIVVRGFDFTFLDNLGFFRVRRDNHLKEFGIRPVGSAIEVYYADKEDSGGADRFDWTVEWAALRPNVVVGPLRTVGGMR